jgi:hypothetical protein
VKEATAYFGIGIATGYKWSVWRKIWWNVVLISNFLRLMGELFGLPTYWRWPLEKVSAELK